MSDHQKTTALRLKGGTIPVNEHTKIETAVIVDETKGLNLQDILDDFETRITTLEP